MENKNKKWIGIDLDGTLAFCEGEPAPDEIGEPIPIMLDFVKELIKQGFIVKIFTARVCQPDSLPYIEKWLTKHGLIGLEITNIKDWDCIRIYDDKAITIAKNMGLMVGMAPPTFLTITQEG